jgi:hypothetical protein
MSFLHAALHKWDCPLIPLRRAVRSGDSILQKVVSPWQTVLARTYPICVLFSLLPRPPFVLFLTDLLAIPAEIAQESSSPARVIQIPVLPIDPPRHCLQHARVPATMSAQLRSTAGPHAGLILATGSVLPVSQCRAQGKHSPLEQLLNESNPTKGLYGARDRLR